MDSLLSRERHICSVQRQSTGPARGWTERGIAEWKGGGLSGVEGVGGG